MDKDLLQKVVNFRRELHQYPEISFKEFQTHKRIKKMLVALGVPEGGIREIGKEGQLPTGMIVDIKGKAEAKGNNFCVAFRADIDALSMLQLNDDLPYKSKNVGAAHMCGHDGHTACLVGFAALIIQKLEQIPNNKTVRLLFQPSEEGPQEGALLMIQKGCLEGVSEIYGFHNWPCGKFGDIWCKEGPVMAKYTELNIKIIGQGGHGSSPQGIKVAIFKGIWFYQQIQDYIKKLQSQNRNFICTLPMFQAGERVNVISQNVYIGGTVRTFEEQTLKLVLNKIKELLGEVEKEGFKVEFKYDESCLTSNTKAEAENVIRVGKQFLGEDRVSPGDLPFRGSEDFGYYTMKCPGAFFFFCTNKNDGSPEPSIHNGRFNFKDQLIEIAVPFWLKLAMDRITKN